jgi:nicotinamide-nucleotide amidase
MFPEKINNSFSLTMSRHLESILNYLHDQKLRLATAESCTAGLIASTIAEIPGCGSLLECAFVTYSPEAKINSLGVKRETIDAYGLTSEQVAREMAEGALRISRANLAVSDTGLAGPSNGDSDIPVGTVCFAWSFEEGDKVTTFSETRKFDGERNQVRQASADYAISRIWYYHNEVAKSRSNETMRARAVPRQAPAHQ